MSVVVILMMGALFFAGYGAGAEQPGVCITGFITFGICAAAWAWERVEKRLGI